MLQTANQQRPLNIAFLGTRGIPANYGGFETFAEELSVRLAKRAHRVTVYGRSHFVSRSVDVYRGVDIRVLPAVRRKYLETVSHTALSVITALIKPYDIVLICNAANAFVCWIPKLFGQKVVLNVDGLDRLRGKWNVFGKAYCRFSEFLSTLLPDKVVTDARSIQGYYRQEYGFHSEFIPYGASTQKVTTYEVLKKLNLAPGGYVLYVSRLEPENNAHLVIRAYRKSGVNLPLVVVGDATYSQSYIRKLHQLAENRNIILPGAIYGRGYRELLSHSRCYIHGTEVGGTHPALIEAMGCGCVVIANSTCENREVLADSGLFYPFNNLTSLSQIMGQVCARVDMYESYRKLAQQRVHDHYNWEQVVNQYEKLFYELCP